MASQSPAVIALGLLQTASVVAAISPPTGWQGRIGRLTESPHTQVALIDVAAAENPNPKWLLNFPSLQALVRGSPDDYEAAYDKAKEVQDVLLGLDPFDTANGDRWSGVTGLGDIGFVYWDNNSRPVFSVNFRILLEFKDNALSQRDSL